MSWFAVYEQATGRLVSTGQVVASDADLTARGLAKKTLAFNPQVPTKEWDEGLKDFKNAIAPKGNLSAREFFERFTPAERETIFFTARTNKRLAEFIEMVKIADGVSLDSSYVQGAVNRMNTAGLIGPGRAAEVLA